MREEKFLVPENAACRVIRGILSGSLSADERPLSGLNVFRVTLLYFRQATARIGFLWKLGPVVVIHCRPLTDVFEGDA
jgi:hypothetical protein